MNDHADKGWLRPEAAMILPKWTEIWSERISRWIWLLVFGYCAFQAGGFMIEKVKAETLASCPRGLAAY